MNSISSKVLLENQHLVKSYLRVRCPGDFDNCNITGLYSNHETGSHRENSLWYGWYSATHWNPSIFYRFNIFAEAVVQQWCRHFNMHSNISCRSSIVPNIVYNWWPKTLFEQFDIARPKNWPWVRCIFNHCKYIALDLQHVFQ